MSVADYTQICTGCNDIALVGVSDGQYTDRSRQVQQPPSDGGRGREPEGERQRERAADGPGPSLFGGVGLADLKLPPSSNTGVTTSPGKGGNFPDGGAAVESYYVGAPAVDYLTLSTWDEKAYFRLRSLAVGERRAELKGGNWLQYSGEQGPSYFSGVALQGGRSHYLVRVSGARAHDVAAVIRGEAGATAYTKATRFDVQVTVPLWSGFRLGDLGLQLERRELGEFRGRRARQDRRIKTVRGDDELDTVYIGSRESVKFIRVYVKEIAGVRHVRFEVEYKGDLAVQAWQALQGNGDAALGPLLRAELDGLPAGFVEALSPVGQAVADYAPDRLQLVRGDATWERQLRWIRHQVAPTLEKLLASPAREEIRFLLSDWLERF